MIVTLEQLEKDLAALSKALTENPEEIWKKAILKEADEPKGKEKLVTFDVAMSYLPMNEYGQKIYANSITSGFKEEQEADSYLPLIKKAIAANTVHGLFGNISKFMNDPSTYLKDTQVTEKKGEEETTRGLNDIEKMQRSFSALMAYKIIFETVANFESQLAGKSLEFIAAGLTGGVVPGDDEIEDFISKDGDEKIHYSLKLLKPDAKFEGNFLNLLKASVKDKKKIVYLSVDKTIDGETINFEELKMDKIKSSPIQLKFNFYTVDPEKLKSAVIGTDKYFNSITKSKQFREKFYNIEINKNYSGSEVAGRQDEELADLKSAIQFKEQPIREKGFRVEFLKNMIDLAKSAEKLDNFKNTRSSDEKIMTNRVFNDNANKVLKTADDIKDLVNIKDAQEARKSLKNQNIPVSKIFLVFILTDGEYQKDANMILKSLENFDITAAANKFPGIKINKRQIIEKVAALTEKGVLESPTTEEINLAIKVFRYLRGFKARGEQLEYKPLKTEKIINLENEKTDPEFVNKFFDIVLSDEFAASVKPIKEERSLFFQRYCYEEPDKNPVSIEFSLDRFTGVFESFGEELEETNKTVVSSIREVCKYLTSFNRGLKTSLTEGMTKESLRDPYSSLRDLVSNWNTMAREKQKQEK